MYFISSYQNLSDPPQLRPIPTQMQMIDRMTQRRTRGAALLTGFTPMYTTTPMMKRSAEP